LHKYSGSDIVHKVVDSIMEFSGSNKESWAFMTRLQEQLNQICTRYRIEIMYAFGSRSGQVQNFLNARGEIDKESPSDADIGVKISGAFPLSIRDKVNLTSELEQFLGVGRVDLVVLSEADPFLAANVVRGERISCGDDYLADEYELYVLRRAGDLAPMERERLSLIFKEAS
jgi:predicted nucleotidyltransferase